MARPPKARDINARNTETDAQVDPQALAVAGQALTQRASELSIIDMQFALDGDYDFGRIDSMMPAMSAMHATSMLWLGRALILVKEHEPQGTFYQFLQRHDFPDRTARKYMAVAARYGEGARQRMIDQLGISKALELASEDDTTLDALADGGTLAGLTLDDVDRMSVRELKSTLRAERQERADEKQTDEEIIRAKDERINKLTRDRRKGSDQSKLRAQAEDMLRDADEAVVEAASQIARLRKAYSDVEQLYADAGVAVEADITTRLDGNSRWAADQLSSIADLLGE